MTRRHLITITLMAIVFLFSAGFISANHVDDLSRPSPVVEPALNIEDQARFEQLAGILGQSATGSHLLDLKETYKVKVRYEAGQGSSFMQAANRIRLETSLAPVHAALIFAHEMNHAQTFHEGNKANRKSESRQTYVHQMLWEEAEGMAVSIQVKMELERIGVYVANIDLPLEDDYRQAYQGAVDRARLFAPSMNGQQFEVIGKAAGVQALFEAHIRGETSTSNTHETVVDYYSRLWDEAHPVYAFWASLVG